MSAISAGSLPRPACSGDFPRRMLKAITSPIAAVSITGRKAETSIQFFDFSIARAPGPRQRQRRGEASRQTRAGEGTQQQQYRQLQVPQDLSDHRPANINCQAPYRRRRRNYVKRLSRAQLSDVLPPSNVSIVN